MNRSHEDGSPDGEDGPPVLKPHVLPGCTSMISIKWPFIVDFPMKNGGSFHCYVSSPEGNSEYSDEYSDGFSEAF